MSRFHTSKALVDAGRQVDATPRPWRRAALVVAAGLVGAALASPVSAQYRQEGGRALDANPRAGSGGRNEDDGTGRNRNPLVTGNQIITGNVTAGRQFRGPINYTDPSEIRALTAGNLSDRFIRESAGVPRSGGIRTEVNLAQPQAFYGSDRATPPPAGYVPTVGASGGYIAASPSAINQTVQNRSYNLGLQSTAQPGELLLPTLDETRGQSFLTASPLQGVRLWEGSPNSNSLYVLPGQLGQSAGPLRPGEGAMDRFRADYSSVLQMRDELNRLTGPGVPESGANGQAGQGGAQGQGQAAGLVQPLNTTIGGTPGAANGIGTGNANGPGNATGGSGTTVGPNAANALQSNALSTQLNASVIGGESGQTNQGVRYRLNLTAADRQTPQLAELRRQYDRRHGTGATDAEAAQEFNLEMRTKRELDAKAKTNKAGPQSPDARGRTPGGAQPGTPGGDIPLPATRRPDAAPESQPDSAPAAPAQPTGPDSPSPAPRGADIPAGPVRIKSLADNVQAKGLRDLLTSAEDLMRQEKYAAALDRYNTAQEVAPDNPLIAVGRAHAELAASLYRRAETDLREAQARAPHLADAQFDLKSLVGADRLEVIIKDLKQLADSDKTEARPLILLAYIAYHTDNKDQAAAYLDAALKRTKGEDTLMKAWRDEWNLPKPEDAAPQDANK